MSTNNRDMKSKRLRMIGMVAKQRKEGKTLSEIAASLHLPVGDEVRELVTICESAEKNRQKK